MNFRFGVAIDSIAVSGDAVTSVRVFDEQRRSEDLVADGYVVALGSYSPLLLSPLRVPCNVYPAKDGARSNLPQSFS